MFGVNLYKSGRTTHVTCGEVLEIEVVAIRQDPNNITEIKREMIRTNIKTSYVGGEVGRVCDILPLPVNLSF
ncbi:8328_t:CDS:2 [Gigaspora margarita]|uniref:8328_t:CDS:1 n=1 Tax=Gigaspora margarita TaxID=4874 RepID=A0ABN7VZM6_GIGMA|nr:8328_t:CDS:2 [Gigaspora margarita]